jgi:hypothetical protein
VTDHSRIFPSTHTHIPTYRMPTATQKMKLVKRALDINNMPEYDIHELMSRNAVCRRGRLRKRARAQETVPCACKNTLLATDIYKYEGGECKKGVILKFVEEDWVAEVEFEDATIDRVDLASPQVCLATSTCLKMRNIPEDVIEKNLKCPVLTRRTPSPAPIELDTMVSFELPPQMLANIHSPKTNGRGHVYTRDEEEFLLRCVESVGKKWSRVASEFATKYDHIRPALTPVQIRSKYCRMESTTPMEVIADTIYTTMMRMENNKMYQTIRAQLLHVSNDESEAVKALLNIHSESS